MARKIMILYTLGTIDRKLFEAVRDLHIRHRDVSAAFGATSHESCVGVIFAVDSEKLAADEKVRDKITAVHDFYEKSETPIFTCGDTEKEIIKACKQAVKKIGELDDDEESEEDPAK